MGAPSSAKATPKPKPKPKPIQDRVAVLELRNLARLDRGEVSYLSNLLRQAAGRLPQSRFLVMTNDNLEALLPPEVDLESCDSTCPIEVGRTIQADWLLVGEVIKFGANADHQLSKAGRYVMVEGPVSHSVA